MTSSSWAFAPLTRASTELILVIEPEESLVTGLKPQPSTLPEPAHSEGLAQASASPR